MSLQGGCEGCSGGVGVAKLDVASLLLDSLWFPPLSFRSDTRRYTLPSPSRIVPFVAAVSPLLWCRISVTSETEDISAWLVGCRLLVEEWVVSRSGFSEEIRRNR